MRLGLLGTGYWGANHLRVLKALVDAGRLESVVVADVDAARARAAAKEVGCDAATPEAMLRDAGVQAVAIVTPTATHFDLARKALLAGKHALVEKPMTQRATEARELVALAQRAGRVLMPGHLFRYHPGIVALRGALARHELGEVRYLTALRQAFREPRTDMGVLHALAVHELDLFSWLLGRDYPDTVQCVLGSWQQPGVDEVAWLDLRFAEVRAHATESWSSPWGGKERHLAVFGSRGAARVDFQDLRQVAFYDFGYEAAQAGGFVLRNEGQRVVPLAYKEPLAAELEDFVHCCQGGGQPVADMHGGLRAVEMLEACQRSAREGRAVSIS